MDLTEIIKTRRSIRRYKSTKIPDRVVDSLIECARHAPSAGDTQPWEFIIVRDKGVKERLAETHGFSDFVLEAPVCIVVLANEKISPNYFSIDVACAVENLLLAAHSIGLGACWVAVFDPLNPNFERHVRAVLNVPSHLRVISMVPIGYPNEKVEPRKLRDLDKIVHYDKY